MAVVDRNKLYTRTVDRRINCSKGASLSYTCFKKFQPLEYGKHFFLVIDVHLYVCQIYILAISYYIVLSKTI